MFVSDHPPTGLSARTLRERNLDHAFILRDFRTDHDQIVFFDLSRLESSLKRRACLRGTSEQKAAAGVRIQPVHRRRQPLESTAELGEPPGDRLPPASRLPDPRGAPRGWARRAPPAG